MATPLFRGAFTRLSILRNAQRPTHNPISRRLFSSADVSLPAQRPLGAFRGGLFGFLFGSTVAGASVYYYILRDYQLSNEMLTEDIYALQAATQRLSTYISELESKMDQLQKK